MILKFYGAAKVATVILSLITAVAIIAVDPTVKVALIVATPSMIGTIITAVLAFLNRQDAKATRQDSKVIRAGVNGINTHLRDKVDAQRVELKEKTTLLAHAEGRREGVESQQAEAPAAATEERRRAK